MRSMLWGLLVLFLCAAAASELFSQEPVKKAEAMPVYVTPYYNSKGPAIRVGKFSKELSSATAESILDVVKKMKKEWQTLSAEAMYVTAIRLYDTGHKDEAVFWFYSAQYRARVLHAIIPAEAIGTIGEPGFERQQALGAFFQLAGQYINGYAFGDLEKLGKVLDQVVSENAKVADYKEIYPKQMFIPEEEWAEKSDGVAEGLKGLRKQIADPQFAEEIKATRKKAGIEGKY